MSRQFDGSTGYLYRGIAPLNAYPFTMSCRFRFFGGGGGGTILMMGNDATFNDFAKINVDGVNTPGSYVLNTQVRNGALVFTTSPVFSGIGNWHTVTAVHSGVSDHRIFYDGFLVALDTTTAPAPSGAWQAVYIGAENESGFAAFTNGLISQCAIWNVALTDAEAKAVHRMTPRQVRPAAQVDYWP
jgi:hypothetical protein